MYTTAASRLRATSDAGVLDGAEELVLVAQHEQAELAGHDSDPELVGFMVAPAQVRFAPTTAALHAPHSTVQRPTGTAGASDAAAVARAAEPVVPVVPATPQATAQASKSIKTRLSTPRYFYH